NAFRIFRHEEEFSSVAGIPVLSGAGTAARRFALTYLQPDTDEHVGVAAVDVAGNMGADLESLLVRLESDLPPAVAVSVTNLDLSSVRLSWESYPKNGLVGFAGFRVFVSEEAFSSVDGMTAVAELGTGVSDYEAASLDRTRE